MRFSEEAERFLSLGAERLVTLAGLLAARGIPYTVAKTGRARHILARVGSGYPRLVIAAHYDRYPGSPGCLDNSCACLQLVEFAARAASNRVADAPNSSSSQGGVPPSLLIAFTDAEEAPATGGAEGQGSYSLARAFRAAFGAEGSSRDARRATKSGARFEVPPVLVLDVTGRGDRLVLSSTPGELLARHGLAGGKAAHGHRNLVALATRAAARARLHEPIRHPLPWSDDLGLVLGGLSALVVSLLPAEELPVLRAGGKPATWNYLHGPDDGPELASDASFDLMSRFLDAVALEEARR